MIVGDMVVCISDDWTPRLGIVSFPVKGCVYTVGEIIDAENHYNVRGTYLRLEEIKNPVVHHVFPNGAERTGEPMFNIIYFRPVKRTDISALIPCDLVEPL